MITYTNEGCKTALETIAALYMKLGALKPTENFTLEDISNTMTYLDHYKHEIKRELRQRENL